MLTLIHCIGIIVIGSNIHVPRSNATLNVLNIVSILRFLFFFILVLDSFNMTTILHDACLTEEISLGIFLNWITIHIQLFTINDKRHRHDDEQNQRQKPKFIPNLPRQKGDQFTVGIISIGHINININIAITIIAIDIIGILHLIVFILTTVCC